jgi:hypothetical protein
MHGKVFVYDVWESFKCERLKRHLEASYSLPRDQRTVDLNYIRNRALLVLYVCDYCGARIDTNGGNNIIKESLI